MSTDNSGRYDQDLADWSLDGTRTHLEYLEAVRTEHILIEADDSGEADAALTQPRIPQKRFVLKNRAHALETELTLFEGGWLSVRQHRRNTPGEAQMLNLRYLDPEPEVARYVAKHALYVTGTLLLLGLVTGFMAYTSVLPGITAPVAAAGIVGSMIAFAICAYRTQKRVTFCTTHGRAPALRLLGTLGSFRALRRTVPEITQAIETAPARTGKREEQLRAEMREHYRLRESNIIDQQTCNESTQRLLRHF